MSKKSEPVITIMPYCDEKSTTSPFLYLLLELLIVSIVLDCELNDFDKQAQEVIEELAKEGIQYGEKFIISRVKRS